MVGISSSTGLVTGIDIAGTVKQLMAFEAQPRDRLVTRTKAFADEQDALSQLTASVLGLQFSAAKFALPATFNARTASSSNSSALSATITGTPRLGSTQFTPIRTAQSQQYLSSGVATLTSPLSAGKITLSSAPRIDKGIALTELNGGEGVQRGKIRITDRSGASDTIDLRYATTIDDVLTAINSSDALDVTASIEGDRLKLVDNTGKTVSNLIVKSLDGGSTAADLGIDGTNVAADSFVGNDLLSLYSGTRINALNDGAGVRLSKDLDDLTITFRDGSTKDIGLRQIAKPEGFSVALTESYDSKFSITAKNAGADYDGVAVVFQDNAGITQGNETVAYDELAKTITVQIAAGSTTASDIISAINNDATASPYFLAQTIDGGTGDGLIDPNDTAITSGGTALSTAVTTAANANARIEISAITPGGEYDDVQILFVDDPGVTQGNETVIYDDSDPFNKTLTVHIKAGESTAGDVINAIGGDPTVSALFSAANASGSTGAGLIDVTDSGITSGGDQDAIGISTAHAIDNVVKLTAKQLGGDYDNVTLRYVNDPSVTVGSEIVEYDESDPNNKTLTVRVAAGQTTADHVIAAISGDPTASARFTAATVSGGTGDRIVDVRSTAETTGGAAQEARSPNTLGDLLTILNEVDPTRLKAQIAADGDRIELIDISADNGGTFSVSSFGDGHAAEDLGIAVSTSGDSIESGRYIGGLKSRLISSLNGGKGLDLGSVKITDRSGASATIDLAGAETVEDILRAVNESGLGVKAEINEAGNGITLRDTTGQFFSNFKVENTGGTNSADLLNITSSTSQTKIESGSLHAQFIGEQSSLDSLNGGKGIDRGKFLIRDSAGNGLIFDTSGDTLQTLGDLIELINSQTKLKVKAEINDTGDGLKFTDLAGGSGLLLVANSGSSTTATSLGIAGSGVIAPGDTKQSVSGSFNKVVNIEAGETISDVITKINALDIGISASSFDFGSGSERFRISLTSDTSGAAGGFQIDSLASTFRFDEIVKGQDALLLFGSNTASSAGVLTTSSTNTFANVVEGLSLTIKEASTTPVNINVESSTSSLITSAKAFVEQYNSLRDKLDGYTTFSETNFATGILFGSNEAHRIESELSEMLTRRYPGLGKYQSLQQLGFSYSETGQLSLDEAKLADSYNADPKAVEDFFTKTQTSGGVETKVGFAARLDKLMDSFAGAGRSLLVSRIQALQTKVDSNNERIDIWAERLDRKQAALLKQFYTLETTISNLQANLTAISSIEPISIDGS